jgi:hypothetical protein
MPNTSLIRIALTTSLFIASTLTTNAYASSIGTISAQYDENIQDDSLFVVNNLTGYSFTNAQFEVFQGGSKINSMSMPDVLAGTTRTQYFNGSTGFPIDPADFGLSNHGYSYEFTAFWNGQTINSGLFNENQNATGTVFDFVGYSNIETTQQVVASLAVSVPEPTTISIFSLGFFGMLLGHAIRSRRNITSY